MEKQEIIYIEDRGKKNQNDESYKNQETDLTKFEKKEIENIKIENSDTRQNKISTNNANQSYTDEEFDFVEEEDNTINNVTIKEEKRSDDYVDNIKLESNSISIKEEPQNESNYNQANQHENIKLKINCPQNINENTNQTERMKCEELNKIKIECESNLIIDNETNNSNFSTFIHNKTEVKEEFEFNFIEDPEKDGKKNDILINNFEGKCTIKKESDYENINNILLQSNIQEISNNLIENKMKNEEGKNRESLIQISNIEDNFNNKIENNINHEEIFNSVDEENQNENTKNNNSNNTEKQNNDERFIDKNNKKLKENDEFDFYEAPEENKVKSFKNDIFIDDIEEHEEELEKKNEKIRDENKEESEKDKEKIDYTNTSKEIENFMEFSEKIADKFENYENHKINDNNDFEEVEEQILTNNGNKGKNEDSSSNKLKKFLSDDLNIEIKKSIQKCIEINIENNEVGNMFSNLKQIIDEETANKDDIVKNLDIKQIDNAYDKFDFVEEKAENSIDKNSFTKSERNELNENLEQNYKKNQDKSFKEEELEEKNEKIIPEFDSKKILEYSFSSSEEEEDQKNIKNKKLTKSPENKNSVLTQVLEFESLKPSVDIKKLENPDNKTEDELADLDFEDCSENSEHIQGNDKKEKIDYKQSNNHITEEDVFDFVEEENQEVHTKIIFDKSPTEKKKEYAIKDKEIISKIDNNDDEFDFIEETTNNSQTNTQPHIMKTKENSKSYFNIDLRNKDYISNLINNYKSKFIFNNPDYIFFNETSIKNSLDLLTSQSNYPFENDKKLNRKNSINGVQENDVSVSKEFTFNEVSDNEKKDQNKIWNKETTNLILDDHKVTFKEKTEDEEFLDVDNDLQDNKDLNNSNKISCPNKTLNHFINQIDPTMEIKIKKFKDLMNLKFEINESKYNYNNLDFSQQAMTFDKQKNNDFNQTISIQNLIDNLKFFKTEPEINIRGYSLEELNKLSKNYNTKLNIKNTIFNQNVMQFSNETMRSLFFQFSELKLINYNNLQNQNQNKIQNSNKNIDENSLNNPAFINHEKLGNSNVEVDKTNIPNKIDKIELEKEVNFSSQNKMSEEINKNICNTKSNVSSINNKETLNTTINMNNISLNDQINKDRILDNIKELKLLNDKNSDFFNKQKNNNSSQSPGVNSCQQNYLTALNDKDSDKVKQNNKSPKLISKSSGGIDLDSKKIKMEMKAQKALDSDSFDDIKDDDEVSECENNNQKTKFVINEMMSSLFIASNNTQNTNFNLSKDKRVEENEKMSEEKSNESNENKMIEMLKSMGITKKEEHSQSKKVNEIEKNDDKLNELINKLPNLNFLNSKYVEIPDSIFNI